MVGEDLKMSKILVREAFENAIKVNAAIGGSTNFIVHLLAIAGRAGVELDLDDFDRLGSHLPLLVNLMPSGKYLMEDFYYAGGLPVVIQELADQLHMDALTVTGKTLGANIAGTVCHDRDVIAPLDQPLIAEAGLAVLRGNLCEGGAIIKPSAASPKLMQHRGQAVVFETIEDYHERI
ncbi:MAG: dihydroxy-acid dehydratase, partial [Planctomycetota bacterium]|nr:dihydroxy-acid dehydratase [Planctomycetota bacterium]